MEFEKTIETSEGAVIFTFNPIYTAMGMIYFIAVTAHGGRHHLHMEERSDSWRIVEAPKPPDWLMAYEKELAKAIVQKQP